MDGLAGVRLASQSPLAASMDRSYDLICSSEKPAEEKAGRRLKT